MYYIKKSEWEKMEKEHFDYCGRSINNPNVRVIFEGSIPGNNGKGGTTLLFEGQHFRIVDDEAFVERGGRDENKKKTINVITPEERIYNLVKAARLAEPTRTEELEEIKGSYGAELYNQALNRILREENAIAEILFTAACTGEIETLKAYYDNGGKTGRSYEKFGTSHSLLAGAWRNGNIEVVRYLLDVGERPLEHECGEINLKSLYFDDIIKAAKSLVDYFQFHNKNITKAQEEKINALAETLRKIN